MFYASEDSVAPSTTMATAECMQSLERELLILRLGRNEVFDGVHPPSSSNRCPAPRQQSAALANTPAQVPAQVPAPVAQQAPATQPAPIQAAPAPAAVAQAPAPRQAPAIAPRAPQQHPFGQACNRNNIPNAQRPPLQRANVHACLRAPTEDDNQATDVYDCMLNQTVSLTTQELLAIVPDICAKARVAVTPQCSAAVELSTCTALEQVIVLLPSPSPAVPILADYYDDDYDITPGMLDYDNPQESTEAPIISPLPYDIYANQVAFENSVIKVAPDSKKLRSVYSIVNNCEEVECILDDGCQIVAMSEAVML